MKAALGSLLAIAAGCGGAEAARVVNTAPPAEPTASASPTPSASPSPTPNTSASASRGPRPVPKGVADLSIHIEPGRRQPLDLVGTIDAIAPPRGDSGLDAWSRVTLSTASGSLEIHLAYTPPSLTLPFGPGDRIHLEMDCRRGGWHRVCDAVISDMTRRVLAIIAGSGSDEAAKDWKIERGAVATSEVRAGSQHSVLHTHALRFESEGAAVTVLPHEWKRLLVHGKSYLVSGYEEVWEGARPPDARDHRVFAIVLER